MLSVHGTIITHTIKYIICMHSIKETKYYAFLFYTAVDYSSYPFGAIFKINKYLRI